MDLGKLIKNVNNFNDYISATKDLVNKFSNSKINLNMSTILALNKIRSFEIEYFNKCDENGIAIKILELMLKLPPSKTWGLLGKEVVALIQFWLDALRKNLISSNNHWWIFLTILLKFSQDICLKHPSINKIVVQEISECFLDIATGQHPDMVQRYKIIQCFNKLCSESSREIRFAMRSGFEVYFIRLSRLMANCGDLRTQYCMLETLLRWLLPRQDLAVRKDASSKWFPRNIYNGKSVDIFLKRTWQNFFKDARDFLNALNEATDVVTSVLCSRFSVEKIVLISGTDKKDYWIDLNTGSKCISMVLERELLEALGSSTSLSDALIISDDNTSAVQLRGDSDTLITLTLVDAKALCPSKVLEGRDVTIALSPASDVRRVDRALRNIFDSKYQLLKNIKDSIQLSPRRQREASRTADTSDFETKIPHPVDWQRRKHAGYIIRPRNPNSWQSPSTASTSSLAMLREKLTAFPGYKFDKEPVSICAEPQLSNVTELSETDERSCLNSSLRTLKLRSYGVCYKNRARTDKKSQSDTEGAKEDRTKRISPIINDDDNSISCLLVATIGSASDSIINDTIERLPKNKDLHTDNIVDMLAQEAMDSTRSQDEDKIDSAFLTSDKIQEHDDKENTSVANKKVKNHSRNKSSKRVNKPTAIDELNTDVIEVTQHIDNIKTKNINKNTIVNQNYDHHTVEDFFSQHVSEHRGDIVISPSLAKKINETSSESSDLLDFCSTVNVDDFHDMEVIDCLNEMIDAVCKDIEKCSEYLIGDDKNNTTNELTEKVTRQVKSKNDRKAVKEIKLKFTNTRKQTRTRGRKKNKFDTEIAKRMSPIIERDSVIEDMGVCRNPEIPKRSNDSDTPLRRKRKLYSPKDDQLVNQRTGVHVSETEEDNSILPDNEKNANTPKSLAVSYKDLENIRRRSIRKLREPKFRSAPSLSPRSKKMNDMFDNLKKKTEGEEKVTIVSKKPRNKQYSVYNFTSDSDDDDFKYNKSKKNLSRKTSKRTVQTTNRRRRSIAKVNYSEINTDSTEEHNTKNTYVRQKTKKGDRKNKIPKPKNETIDERMREAAPEVLNTSMIIEQKNNNMNEPNPEPVINNPQIEEINDENVPLSNKMSSKRNKKDLALNKGKTKKNIVEINSDTENTESPLPGLIIETVRENNVKDECFSDVMLEKIKDMENDTLPDVSELNNTQNLLLDTDQYNKTKLNKTNEGKDMSKQTHKITPIEIKTEKSRKRNKRPSKTKSERNIIGQSESITNIYECIDISDRIDIISEKSINTIGKSPITAHVDFNESPPNAEQLKEFVSPREIETQDYNQSMKDYFDKLTMELNEISNNSSNDLKEQALTEKSPPTSPKKSLTVSIQRLSAKDLSRWLTPRYNSIFGSNPSSHSETSTSKTRTNSKHYSKPPIIKKKCKESSTGEVYKSIISPVKMFGELDKKEKSVSSQGDDYVERIKMLMTTRKEISKPRTSELKSSRYELCKQKITQDSCSRTSRISKSCHSKQNTPVKRKSSSTFEVTEMKKVRDDSSIDLTIKSGPSSSSVQEWMKKNERDRIISTAESLDLSLRDGLENIMEKLDTTLVEIHHKTSKKFVNMFVDTQKYLNELKAQRHEMFRETAKDVMTEVVKVLNDKFASLDRRSEELDEQFIVNLREKAQNLIREDCKEKRVMVNLLKEDAQRVMDHIKDRTNDK